MMERSLRKRKVKPAQVLLEFEDLSESSDDSDFRIEDHYDGTDDDSVDSGGNEQSSGEDGSEGSGEMSDISRTNEIRSNPSIYLPGLSETHNKKMFNPKNALNILICSVCLREQNDSTNEIIECDHCGITVHEGCYGIQDSDSVCSSDSLTPTAPWFCDACKAGQEDPICELCPNSGGIFKETDVGKWVHLVCALYVPGVAFAEVDKLQSVTLFEMTYSKWGAKDCSICPDQQFSRTGVAIGCDAGMCKTHFHVTCGHKEGLLSEAHSEEVDQVDPFYAHCKLHADKNVMRKQRRNYLSLQMRIEARKLSFVETEDSLRIQRRLDKCRVKYENAKQAKKQPWVPTQKMGRLLTTSPFACRALWRKAELSGVDTENWALRQAQVEALSDVHRRWNIQPAFSVEFIGYYLDRNNRVTSMRKQLTELLEENSRLLEEQSTLEAKRDNILKENNEEYEKNKALERVLNAYCQFVTLLCINKKIPFLMAFKNPVNSIPYVSEAEKMNVKNICGLCRSKQDQHLLAKCDTCHKHYHLACLIPPLSRMPKKNKLMGWQCSECDKETSSDVELGDTDAPRKLRHKDHGDFRISNFKHDSKDVSIVETLTTENPETTTMDTKPDMLEETVKKRKREKHHRYSPDPNQMRGYKYKHKRSKQQVDQRQSLKIYFKSVPKTGGGSSYEATPSASLPSTSFAAAQPPHVIPSPRQLSNRKKDKPKILICVTCNTSGESSNIVQCDECLLGFHFQCLIPPVKKSPKVRGYSWHCANCDPTESE